MNLKVRCQCGTTLLAPSEKAGTRAKCPKCGAAVQIPSAFTGNAASESDGSNSRGSSTPAKQKSSVNSKFNARPSSQKITTSKSIELPNLSSDLDELGISPINDLELASKLDGPPVTAHVPSLHPLKHRSAGLPMWAWSVGGAGVIVVLALFILFVNLVKRSDSTIEPANSPSTVATAPPVTVPAPIDYIPSTAVSSAARSDLARAPISDRANAPTITPSIVVPEAQPHASKPASMGESVATAKLIESVHDGIVNITALNNQGEEIGAGTGFVIDAVGLIGTNFHVIAESHTAKAQFRNGESFDIAGVRAFDRSRDLAIIQLKSYPRDMQVLPLLTTANPQPGSGVIVIGHPREAKLSVRVGTVGAVRTTVDLPEDVRELLQSPLDNVWIETDVAISGENSGGPLLNMQGEVLGINTWVGGDLNLGFAMHAQNLAGLQRNLKPIMSLAKLKASSRPDGFLTNTDPRVAELSDTFTEAYKAFRSERTQLIEQGATRQLVARFTATRNPLPNFVKQLFEIAGDNRNTEVAFQSLGMICLLAQYPSSVYPPGSFNRAADQIIEDHIDEPNLTDLLMLLIKTEEKQVLGFIRRVIKATTDKEVCGKACLALAMAIDADATYRARYNSEKVALANRIIDEFAEMRYENKEFGRIAKLMLVKVQRPEIGQKAPEIVGIDHEGNEFKLSKYRGKVVVLNFFADWCPYSRQMYDAERRLVERCKDEPFALIGINIDEDWRLRERVAPMLSWRCVVDGPDGPIFKCYNPSIPGIFVLDGSGIVRNIFDGKPPEATLNEAVDKLLAKRRGA